MASLKQLPALTRQIQRFRQHLGPYEPEVVVIHAPEVLKELVVDNPELEGVLTKAFEAEGVQVSEPVVGTKRAYNRKVKAVSRDSSRRPSAPTSARSRRTTPRPTTCWKSWKSRLWIKWSAQPVPLFRPGCGCGVFLERDGLRLAVRPGRDARHYGNSC